MFIELHVTPAFAKPCKRRAKGKSQLRSVIVRILIRKILLI